MEKNSNIIIAPSEGNPEIDLSELHDIKDLKSTLELAKAHPDVSAEDVKKIENRINVLAIQNKTSLESAKLTAGSNGDSFGPMAEYIDAEDCQGV